MKTKFRKMRKTRALLPSIVVVLLVLAVAVGGVLAKPSRTSSSAAAIATLPAETCSYDGLTNTRTCEFWAVAGTFDLPGAAGMPIWGFTDTDPALGGISELPGPTIIAYQGENIEVILHNELSETTSMVFPGQAMVPDLTGVGPGGTTTYNFAATNPGTYLYEAGLLPGAQHQVAMGLYGALIVRPSSFQANQAYGPGSIFDDEALLVLSDLDPALNNSADPAAFDMRDYKPRFFLINGLAYPNTDEIPSAAGNTVLLRFANAGIVQHSMGTLGLIQEIIAFDGSPLTYPYNVATATIGSGQTSDRMVIMPDPAPAGGAMYALYDAGLLMHNDGAAGFGGMLTFITITDGTTPDTGPTASNVALSPNLTDGTVDVTLSATITGSSPIMGAEYFINTQGATGTGMPMLASDGAFDSAEEAVEATISVADLSALSTGDHTFYVRGTDGTWGAFNFAVLQLDKMGPATSAISLAPNPNDGGVNVALSATGNDTASGNSNITGAEFFIDTTGADGTGTMMTVNIAEPIASLTGTITAGLAEGEHTIFVHSKDAFEWWGDYATATLVIDQTGPTTSNVVADPNPNNGSEPYSPTIFAVRVDASLSDTSSNIQQAEGFIDTIGADGSGFPLTPRDGLFNETTEDAYVYIPLSTISQLSVGTHQIYVHAQDASGNWGAADFVDFVIDADAPTVGNVVVDPATTDGTVLVTLTAEATDTLSDIDMAEWFVGADPGVGNGTTMTAIWNLTTMVWDLAGTIDANGWAAGDYTVFVRARDAAGNWSGTASATLNVTAGPPPVPTTLYFSTSGNGNVPGAGGPFDDADVYFWDGADFSRVFDGTAEGGLPGNTGIDALAFDGALFYMSFNRNGGTNVPGLGVIQDEDVVTYNPVDFQWEVFFAGADICDGLDASNGHDVDAFDVQADVIFFSTEGDAALLPLAGPFDDADIYMVDAAGCSRVFDASVEGLPAGANVDGLSAIDADTFYMSFDQDDVSVPGLGLIQDEDVVLFDAGVWSLYFDGTAQGLGSNNNQNLDAVDIQ